MDKCNYHPDYDPASGEPTGIKVLVANTKGSEFPTYKDEPCPYCLQARVGWLTTELETSNYAGEKLADVLATRRKTIDELEERVDHLFAENVDLITASKGLEQDGKRLDWLERNWCDKVKNKFKEDVLVVGGVETRGTDLRQVIDKAMKERGSDGQG